MRARVLAVSAAAVALALLASCERALAPEASPSGTGTTPTSAAGSDPTVLSQDGATTVDSETGMVMTPGWEVVRDHCVACHSPQQFLRQRGTRQTWSEIVLWMQEEAGLGKIAPEAEQAILDYLVTHNGPREGHYRRAPLSPRLLPPNPYESEIEKSRREAGEAPPSGS